MVRESVAAQKVAEKAFEESKEAEARANRAEEEEKAGGGVSHHSAKAADAIYRSASAAYTNEFNKQEKMKVVVDSMEKLGEVEDRNGEDAFRKLRRQEVKDLHEEEKEDRDMVKMVKAIDHDDEVAKEAGDKRVKRTKRQLEREEREEADEVRKDKKALHEARITIDSVKNREKVWQNGRAELEKATALRLWKEADKQRGEAIRGDLEEGEVNGTLEEAEILSLLDINKNSLYELTDEVDRIAKHDPGANVVYQDHVETIRYRASTASAHLVEGIRHKTEVFSNASAQYSEPQVFKQLVSLIAKFFNDTKTEVKMLQQTSDSIEKNIQGWDAKNPEKLSGTLAMALNGVTGSVEFKHRLLALESDQMAHVNSTAEACELLDNMLTSNLQPAFNSLVHMKDKLDRMAKVVPSILKPLPYDAAGLMERPTTLLMNMAYVQHVALTESATIVLTQAAPAILERLHCTVDSAGARASVGLAAVALAAWLAA